MPRIKVDGVEPDRPVSTPKPVDIKTTKPERSTDREIKQVSGTSIFSAFRAFPDGVLFSGEGRDEQIILLLRAHIITNAPWVLTALGLVLVPFLLFPLINFSGLPVNPASGFFYILLWYMGIFTYAFVSFLYWYFNVYIVTNERVVDVDWYSIIYRKVSATQIDKIQDISASNIGVLAGLFDYGNVEIQTAGEEPNFEFTAVPHPQLVAKEIGELQQKEEDDLEGRS